MAPLQYTWLLCNAHGSSAMHMAPLQYTMNEDLTTHTFCSVTLSISWTICVVFVFTSVLGVMLTYFPLGIQDPVPTVVMPAVPMNLALSM